MSDVAWLSACVACFLLGAITEAAIRKIRKNREEKQNEWWNEPTAGMGLQSTRDKEEKQKEKIRKLVKILESGNSISLKLLQKILNDR